jgi:hypothetical protein
MNRIEFAGFCECGDEHPKDKEFNSPVMSVNSIGNAERPG